MLNTLINIYISGTVKVKWIKAFWWGEKQKLLLESLATIGNILVV